MHAARRAARSCLLFFVILTLRGAARNMEIDRWINCVLHMTLTYLDLDLNNTIGFIVIKPRIAATSCTRLPSSGSDKLITILSYTYSAQYNNNAITSGLSICVYSLLDKRLNFIKFIGTLVSQRSKRVITKRFCQVILRVIKPIQKT